MIWNRFSARQRTEKMHRENKCPLTWFCLLLLSQQAGDVSTRLSILQVLCLTDLSIYQDFCPCFLACNQVGSAEKGRSSRCFSLFWNVTKIGQNMIKIRLHLGRLLVIVHRGCIWLFERRKRTKTSFWRGIRGTTEKRSIF